MQSLLFIMRKFNAKGIVLINTLGQHILTLYFGAGENYFVYTDVNINKYTVNGHKKCTEFISYDIHMSKYDNKKRTRRIIKLI